jgi:hypothetical protein
MAWIRFVDGRGNYCLARIGFAKIGWLGPGSVPRNEANLLALSSSGDRDSPRSAFPVGFFGDLLAFRGRKNRGQSPSQNCFDLLALRVLSPWVCPQKRSEFASVEFRW